MVDKHGGKLPIIGLLPSKWQIVEFGAVLEGGTRNGIYKPKQFHGVGDKIVNMGELFANPRLYAVSMQRVLLSEDERKSFGLKVGDLLFARRSLVAEGAGKCCIVCEVTEPTTFESSIIRARPNTKIADSMYLYYVFQSRYGSYILDTIRRQVAVAGITGKDLVKLNIPLPSLREQQSIAHILSTIDNKIELNRKINKTLEFLVKAIFKSWFVDFDPVRAKMDGLAPYGMDAEIASLFPDSFEDSQLGKIPTGWRVVPFGDVIIIHDSKRIPLSRLERVQRKGPYPYYGAASVLDYVDGYLFDGIYILMGEDGSVIDDADHPVLQYVWGKFWVNNHTHVLQGNKGVTTEHIMLFLQQVNLRPYVTGAVQPKLNQGNMIQIPFLLPPKEICVKFGQTLSIIFAYWRANILESQTLATIRDTLLPKLLSGEIRAKDAEKVYEAYI